MITFKKPSNSLIIMPNREQYFMSQFTIKTLVKLTVGLALTLGCITDNINLHTGKYDDFYTPQQATTTSFSQCNKSYNFKKHLYVPHSLVHLFGILGGSALMGFSLEDITNSYNEGLKVQSLKRKRRKRE